MGWTIEVGSPNAFTIDAHAKFNLRTVPTWRDNGSIDFLETFLEVEGDIIEPVPSDVADGIVALENQIRANNVPRDVRVKLNGTTKWEYLKSKSFASPRIELFQTIDDEGDGDSHWRYGLTIYVKSSASFDSEPDVSEITTSIKVIKEGGNAVRKIWAASVKGRTIAAALATALSFKPSAKHLHEEIERRFDDRVVNVLWVWEAESKDEVIEVNESAIEYSNFGASYVVSKQVGNPGGAPPAPLLHRARRDATRIIVRGVVRGKDPDKVRKAIPPPHFQENGERKRQRQDETGDLAPRLIDHIKGIYEMAYSEVWISTEAALPVAQHQGHQPANPPKVEKPPGDGRMAARGA